MAEAGSEGGSSTFLSQGCCFPVEAAPCSGGSLGSHLSPSPTNLESLGELLRSLRTCP